jgi:hypothetical protein
VPTIRETLKAFEEISERQSKLAGSLRASARTSSDLAASERSGAEEELSSWARSALSSEAALISTPSPAGSPSWAERLRGSLRLADVERRALESELAACSPEAVSEAHNGARVFEAAAAAAAAELASLDPFLSEAEASLAKIGWSQESGDLAPTLEDAAFFESSSAWDRLWSARLRAGRSVTSLYAKRTGRSLSSNVVSIVLPARERRATALRSADRCRENGDAMSRRAVLAKERLVSLPSARDFAEDFRKELAIAATKADGLGFFGELLRHGGSGFPSSVAVRLVKASRLELLSASLEVRAKACAAFAGKLTPSIPKLRRGASKCGGKSVSVDLDAMRKADASLSKAFLDVPAAATRAARAVAAFRLDPSKAFVSSDGVGFDCLDAALMAMAFVGDPKTAALFGLTIGSGAAVGVESSAVGLGVSVDSGGFPVSLPHLSPPDVSIPSFSVPEISIPSFSILDVSSSSSGSSFGD